MKETKPTAKAARTVVSTPPLIGGRRRPARRRAGARRRRRAAGPRRGPAWHGGAISAPRARRRSTPASTKRIGTSHAVRSKPLCGGSASTPGPNSSTSASLTSCLSLPSAICLRMNARSWSATVLVETLSAVPHSTHITSSSMSGSEACGAAPVANTSSSAASAAILTPSPPAAAAASRPATPGPPGRGAGRRSAPGGRSRTSRGRRASRSGRPTARRGRGGSGR